MPTATAMGAAPTSTGTCETADEDGNGTSAISYFPLRAHGEAGIRRSEHHVLPLSQGSISSPRCQEMHRRVVELAGTQQRLEAQMRVLDAQSLALAHGQACHDSENETTVNASMQAALGAVEQQRDKLYDRLRSVQMAASQYSDILHGVTPAPDDGTWEKLTSTYQQLMSSDVDNLAPEQVLSMAQQAWAVQQEASDDLKDKVESLRKELESSQQQRDQLQQRLKDHESMLTKLHNQCSALRDVMASNSPRQGDQPHESQRAPAVRRHEAGPAGSVPTLLSLGLHASSAAVVNPAAGLQDAQPGPESFSGLFSKEVLDEHVDELLHGKQGFWAGATRELRRVSSTSSATSLERASLRRAISEGNGWMRWGLLGGTFSQPDHTTSSGYASAAESSLEKAWDCFTKQPRSRHYSSGPYRMPPGARISFESTSTESETTSQEELHASVDNVVNFFSNVQTTSSQDRPATVVEENSLELGSKVEGVKGCEPAVADSNSDAPAELDDCVTCSKAAMVVGGGARAVHHMHYSPEALDRAVCHADAAVHVTTINTDAGLQARKGADGMDAASVLSEVAGKLPTHDAQFAPQLVGGPMRQSVNTGAQAAAAEPGLLSDASCSRLEGVVGHTTLSVNLQLGAADLMESSKRDQVARHMMIDTSILQDKDPDGGPLTRRQGWSPMKIPSFWFNKDEELDESSSSAEGDDPLRTVKSGTWVDGAGDAFNGEKLQGQYRRHMQLVQLKELHAKQVLQLSSRHEEAMRQALSQHKAAVENLVRAHQRDLHSSSPSSPGSSDPVHHESHLSKLRRSHEEAMRQLTREHHAEMDAMHKRHYATLRQLLSVLSLLRDGAAQQIVATGERAPPTGAPPAVSAESHTDAHMQFTRQNILTPSLALQTAISAPITHTSTITSPAADLLADMAHTQQHDMSDGIHSTSSMQLNSISSSPAAAVTQASHELQKAATCDVGSHSADMAYQELSMPTNICRDENPASRWVDPAKSSMLPSTSPFAAADWRSSPASQEPCPLDIASPVGQPLTEKTGTWLGGDFSSVDDAGDSGTDTSQGRDVDDQPMHEVSRPAGDVASGRGTFRASHSGEACLACEQELGVDATLVDPLSALLDAPASLDTSACVLDEEEAMVSIGSPSIKPTLHRNEEHLDEHSPGNGNAAGCEAQGLAGLQCESHNPASVATPPLALSPGKPVPAPEDAACRESAPMVLSPCSVDGVFGAADGAKEPLRLQEQSGYGDPATPTGPMTCSSESAIEVGSSTRTARSSAGHGPTPSVINTAVDNCASVGTALGAFCASGALPVSKEETGTVPMLQGNRAARATCQTVLEDNGTAGATSSTALEDNNGTAGTTSSTALEDDGTAAAVSSAAVKKHGAATAAMSAAVQADRAVQAGISPTCQQPHSAGSPRAMKRLVTTVDAAVSPFQPTHLRQGGTTQAVDAEEEAQSPFFAPVERLLQQILPDNGNGAQTDKLQQQLHAAFTADLQDLQKDYVEALKEREQAYLHLLMELKRLRESDSRCFPNGESTESTEWMPPSMSTRAHAPLLPPLSTANMMPMSRVGMSARHGSGGLAVADEFPFTGSIFSELLSTLLLSPQLSKQRKSLERTSRDLFSPSASPASSDDTADIIKLPVPPAFASSWDIPMSSSPSSSYCARQSLRRHTGVYAGSNPTPAVPGARPRSLHSRSQLSEGLGAGSPSGLVPLHSLASVSRAARDAELGSRQPVRRRLMMKSPRARPDSSGLGRSGLAAAGQVLAGALVG